jgi:hypothetical protein
LKAQVVTDSVSFLGPQLGKRIGSTYWIDLEMHEYANLLTSRSHKAGKSKKLEMTKIKSILYYEGGDRNLKI